MNPLHQFDRQSTRKPKTGIQGFAIDGLLLWGYVFCHNYVDVKEILIFSSFKAGIKIFVMILVNWVFALICITVVFVVWFWVGTANPAFKPGIADEFRFFVWLKGIVFQCFGYAIQNISLL